MGEHSERGRSGATASFVLVALTTIVLGESIRVAFPLLYDVRETSGVLTAVAWALVAFVLVPSVGGLLRRAVGEEGALLGSIAALAAARVAMQYVHPIPLWLAAIAVAAGLLALGGVARGEMRRGAGGRLGVAVFVGLAADTAIRGVGATWDPLWRTGLLPGALAIVLAAGLLWAVVVARGGFRSGGGEAARRIGWGLAAVGPFLLLQTLFLQNIAFVASEAGIGLPLAMAVVLGGDLVALLFLLEVSLGHARTGAGRAAVAAVLVGAIAGLALTSSLTAALVLVGQTAAGDLLARALTGDPARTRRGPGASLGLALGMAVFVGFALAYQIDVTNPLPIPRATWPIAAAAVLALTARHAAVAAGLRVSRLALAVPVVGLGAALAAWPTWGSEPRPSIHPTGTVRVLDWNMHTALSADGQIDLEAIAREIEARSPDVVVLQEVGRGWPIAGQADQLAWLARRLEMHATWASAADEQFGNAILTGADVGQAEFLRLPYGAGPQARSALRVRMPPPIGDMWVIGAHLEGDPATRAEQIRTILDAWGSAAPTVLAGDLNMQPDQPDVQLFTDEGYSSVQDTIGDPGASTSRDPNFPGDRVDWIWTSQGLSPSDFVIVQSAASDHLPLVVNVTVAAGR